MTLHDIAITLGYAIGGYIVGWAVVRLRRNRALPPATRSAIDAQPRADLAPVQRRNRAALAILSPVEALILQQLSAGPCDVAAVGARLLPYGRDLTGRTGGILATMEHAGMIKWLRLGDARRAGDGGALIAITPRGRHALASRCP